MKILFFGDSITDMNRERIEAPTKQHLPFALGFGYPFFVAGDLYKESPKKYEVVNRGISGNRIVDLYARIKCDCWNLEPDVISILIGTNDVWHKYSESGDNGVEIERWERIYKMLIEDTQKRLPNAKIMICEPFLVHGTATDGNYENLSKIKEYAKVAKKIAEEYGLPFVALQERLEKYSEMCESGGCLYDGIHPNVGGARVIADAWLDAFKKI